MDIGSAFPSNYIKTGVDIAEDQQITITIKDVEMEMIGQGKDAAEKPVLYCKEFEKGLILNKTNATTISRLYGNDTDGWMGKRITLFVTDVQGPNGMGPGIRIKGKIPAPPREPSRKPAPVLTQAEADAPAEGDEDIPF